MILIKKNIQYIEKYFSVRRNDDVINNVRNSVAVYDDSVRRHHEILEVAAYKDSIANTLWKESKQIKRTIKKLQIVFVTINNLRNERAYF